MFVMLLLAAYGRKGLSFLKWIMMAGGSDGKESACSVEGPGLVPGLGRALGEGNSYPLQYSCLENSMDRGAWWATVLGVTELDMTERLSLSSEVIIRNIKGKLLISL